MLFIDLVYFEKRVPDTSETNATRVRHECDTSEASATQMPHDCDKNDKIATQAKNFDFDNKTSENIFLHRYISYMENERLQGENQFHSKTYLLEMPHSNAKMRLKSAPQKLNFVMAKAIPKKLYTGL